MTPATSAAQNGWRNTFSLTLATPRRRIAPAAALTKISIAGTGCSTPKMTDSPTAPAPAASAKSHVEAGGRARGRGDRLRRGAWRKPPRAELLDRPRRGRDAIHIHAGGIGRHLRDHAAILVVGPKLQFSPARHDLGAQAQDTAELLGRGHSLLGSLAVDVEHPREGEDKAGTLLRRHVSFSQSADSKAATSWSSRGRARRATSSPGHASCSTRPLARWLARHVRLDHFFRIYDAIEFRLRDEAQLQRGFLQREIVVHGVVGDLRGLVVADDGRKRRHQHERALDVFVDLLNVGLGTLDQELAEVHAAVAHEVDGVHDV